MSTLITDGGWPFVANSLVRALGRLGRVAGLLSIVLWTGSADCVSASAESPSAESLSADGCEQEFAGRSIAALPIVTSSQVTSGTPATPSPRKPPTKGTAKKQEGAKPEAAKQTPAKKEPGSPPQPAAPAGERQETKQPSAPTKTDEPAPTAEASKAATVDPVVGGDDIGAGPDELAKKFAELLEKRRVEAAAAAAAKKVPPTPAAKVVPAKEGLQPAAADVEPAATPEPAPAPAPAMEPDAESSPGVEPGPAEGLPAIEGPPTINVLVLQTADALADVPRTERIGQLILTGGNLTNRSMRSLEGLAVTELSIEAIRVSNTGIQYVRSVRGLRRLRLWTPEVDDMGVSHLVALESLEALDVEGTSIQGGGLAQLKGLPNLATLVLGPKASDSQLVALQELPALSQLDLRACPNLTLACIDTLAQLKNLKTVWLPSHIRAKGKRVLIEALPACEVRS